MADAAAIHAEYVETVNTRDFDKMRALLDADYSYTGPDGVEAKGPDAGIGVAQMYTAAFPDLKLEILHQHAANGEVSVIEMRATGTHKGDLPDLPATGKRAVVSICDVIEVRDGKVYREREYYDALSMMQQLGAIPS